MIAPGNEQEKCFYCHSSLPETHFVWNGSNGVTIRFHFSCGVSFGFRMIRNIQNFLKRSEKKSA